MRVARKNIIGTGSVFHKIWRCHNREFLLKDHNEKHAYLRSILNDYTKKSLEDDFVVHGYNIMSNHVHEAGKITGELSAFSDHMRRAHGIFGLHFNKRHKRIGKVAHSRPKTLRVENDEELMLLMFYIDCNPVRAGIIKHPSDIHWKDFSSCRYYSFGERNKYSEMIKVPEWYMKLGKTARQRQRKYRSLLDRYLIEYGLKRDPCKTFGHFIGGELWVMEMRKLLSVLPKKKSTDPPD
jgi:putative transposase